MNKLTNKINSKGYTLVEFLLMINRSRKWFYKHSNGGKDYDLLVMVINGLEEKL